MTHRITIEVRMSDSRTTLGSYHAPKLELRSLDLSDDEEDHVVIAAEMMIRNAFESARTQRSIENVAKELHEARKDEDQSKRSDC